MYWCTDEVFTEPIETMRRPVLLDSAMTDERFYQQTNRVLGTYRGNLPKRWILRFFSWKRCVGVEFREFYIFKTDHDQVSLGNIDLPSHQNEYEHGFPDPPNVYMTIAAVQMIAGLAKPRTARGEQTMVRILPRKIFPPQFRRERMNRGWGVWMPPATIISELTEESAFVNEKGDGRQKPISTPVFLAHANGDEVIDIKLGRQLREPLDTVAKTDESGHAAVSDSTKAFWLGRERLAFPLEGISGNAFRGDLPRLWDFRHILVVISEEEALQITSQERKGEDEQRLFVSSSLYTSKKVLTVGLSSLPAIFAGSVADASATGAELRSSVSRSEHVTGLGAGLDIQRRRQNADRFPSGDLPPVVNERLGDEILMRLLAVNIVSKILGQPIPSCDLYIAQKAFEYLDDDRKPVWYPTIRYLAEPKHVAIEPSQVVPKKPRKKTGNRRSKTMQHSQEQSQPEGQQQHGDRKPMPQPSQQQQVPNKHHEPQPQPAAQTVSRHFLHQHGYLANPYPNQATAPARSQTAPASVNTSQDQIPGQGQVAAGVATPVQNTLQPPGQNPSPAVVVEPSAPKPITEDDKWLEDNKLPNGVQAPAVAVQTTFEQMKRALDFRSILSPEFEQLVEEGLKKPMTRHTFKLSTRTACRAKTNTVSPQDGTSDGRGLGKGVPGHTFLRHLPFGAGKGCDGSGGGDRTQMSSEDFKTLYSMLLATYPVLACNLRFRDSFKRNIVQLTTI
ncbi:serine/threonine protein kinase [Colletotrichum musicola]|uniref:Serine/threonine protein kinase n=1 Tax=Colletotrichum musicola TaxID=2175873 RepID=A0A8H6IWA5_9PEZI|nr:serine/threonine protein kinase [Colletotrichum musicola]